MQCNVKHEYTTLVSGFWYHGSSSDDFVKEVFVPSHTATPAPCVCIFVAIHAFQYDHVRS